MNTSGVWADAKAIADAVPKTDPQDIVAAYEIAKTTADFDLKTFAVQHFEFLETAENGFQSDLSRSPQQHIERLWDVLQRNADTPKAGSSLLPLPYPYIVPGGRFNEIYYWDSYFTMLGLQVSGRTDLIEGMVKNFAHLIQTVGFVPNGNRTYFLGRSQPPFFALMVGLLAEQLGEATWVTHLPFLEKEYLFWTNGEAQLSKHKTAIERVVRVKGGALNRYWDKYDTPRPEMYSNDLETAAESTREAAQLFRDLRAACESGWDFSSRWLRDPQDLATIHASEILPIDLNCLLFNLENTLAKANRIAGNSGKQRQYESKAAIRKDLILRYFWNEAEGFFMDFDFVRGEQKNVFSLAAMFPLFFQICTPQQAKRCAEHIERQFLKAGGLVSTLNETAQQWDAPNGWAPLQWVAIAGLRHYGYHELAQKIADRWVALNTKVYEKTGKMLEKYNVVDTDLETGGGEYPVQDGFGWTNGVLLKLLVE